MDEDDKMDAQRISEDIQQMVEYYVAHSSRSMQTIIGKTLIFITMESMLVEKQLEQCKKRLKENNLSTETDIDSSNTFLPDVRDYVEAGVRTIENITDMELMEKYRKH